jgi:hypothetical protein
MERRFLVKDGDGEVLRTFLTKADAVNFMQKRPEFTLLIIPKQKPTETPFEQALREVGEALL